MTGTRPRAPRLPYAARNEQVLDVAEALFIERGYTGVSMEDIARSAGVSRPVVYEHLGGKEEAYLGCVRRVEQDWLERAVRRTAEETDPRARLVAAADEFFSMLEDNPGRWRLLFATGAVLGGAHERRLAELHAASDAALHQLFVATFPDAPELHLEALAHAAAGTGERLGNWWTTTRPELSRDEVVAHFLGIVWPSLAPWASAPDGADAGTAGTGD